ncbi:MAG TPA: tetratricopeptide repeat protein [Deltaproteobacteria bacterium]|nr:tetratricopeptide repeat protein [Deltaproteobacteria bacterium]HOM29922.1 tetratricopeptide repeat protein [Deltaproteobacteria bacterium]HPP81415.1 tetratricopeptide repeat protein [Deltaproteobacteria bacterium]
MAGSSEKVQKAFDEGRYLDVIKAARTRKNPEDKLLAGISLYRLSRFAEARDVLEKVSALTKSLATAEYYLALIHGKEGDDDAYRACLERYLAYHPDDDEARDLLEGDTMLRREEFVTEPSVELARIYAQQGHYEQALDIYSRLAESRGLDEDARRHASAVQNLYIMKTLEEWLVRLRK